MLERPPGGTTIRRPAGLAGTSSGVGGPGRTENDRDMRRGKCEKSKSHIRVRREDNVQKLSGCFDSATGYLTETGNDQIW